MSTWWGKPESNNLLRALRSFQILVCPYGISSISELYNCCMDETFIGTHNFCKIVDDVVIFDEDKQNTSSTFDNSFVAAKRKTLPSTRISSDSATPRCSLQVWVNFEWLHGWQRNHRCHIEIPNPQQLHWPQIIFRLSQPTCLNSFQPTSEQQSSIAFMKDTKASLVHKQETRLTLYWPGIDRDIENFVRDCCHCQDCLPSQGKEPLISKPLPQRPFQQIAADIRSYAGQQYLIIVDCNTDWPDIIDLGKDTTALHLIESLQDQFCRIAVPRCPLVRWWTTVHIIKTHKFSHKMGCSTQGIITTLPSKQWQSRGHRQINEKVDLFSLDRPFCWLGETLSLSIAVSQHTLLQRWCFPSTKVVGTSNTGSSSSPQALLCICRVAKSIRTIGWDMWVIPKTGRAGLQQTCTCDGRAPDW